MAADWPAKDSAELNRRSACLDGVAAEKPLGGLFLHHLRLLRARHVNGGHNIRVVLAEVVHEPVMARLQVQLQTLRSVVILVWIRFDTAPLRVAARSKV